MPPEYIIHKVMVEANTTTMETANDVKNNIGRFLKDEVFPKIEELLATYDTEDQILRIDEVTLDVNLTSWNYPELQQKILESMTESLTAFNPKLKREEREDYPLRTAEFIPAQDKNKEVFLFFLEKGYLPWHGHQEDLDAFIEEENWKKELDSPVFIDQITQILIEFPSAFKRFILQFKSEIIRLFLFAIDVGIKELAKEIGSIEVELTTDLRLLFLEGLLAISIKKNKSETEDLIIRFYRKMEKGKNQKTGEDDDRYLFGFEQRVRELFDFLTIDSQQRDKKIALTNVSDKIAPKIPRVKSSEKIDKHEAEDLKEELVEWHTPHAGIILLHPFLKHFFTKLEFLDRENKIVEHKWAQAIQTLAFLSTGEEDFFEGDLVLEKHLCDFPMRAPVPRESLLTEAMKSEAEVVLKEVIKNWPALKNTSPDGLRQMFLLRDGKLIRDKQNYRLVVERKSQDVLLNKLDWNTSIFKLPWRKELLFVDW